MLFKKLRQPSHSAAEDLAINSLHCRTQVGSVRCPSPKTDSCGCDDDDDYVELSVLGCRVEILGTNCDQCVCMVQRCFTSTETVRLIRTGSQERPPRLSHSSQDSCGCECTGQSMYCPGHAGVKGNDGGDRPAGTNQPSLTTACATGDLEC